MKTKPDDVPVDNPGTTPPSVSSIFKTTMAVFTALIVLAIMVGMPLAAIALP